MDEKKSTIVIGSPATGTKYWPRLDITDSLKLAIVNDHVIFPGPRRTGKTSLLLDLKKNWESPGKAAFINAEKFSTPSELIQGIAKEVTTPDLGKKTLKFISSGASWVKSVKFWEFGLDFHQAAEKDWSSAADGLLKALMEEPGPTLIMIDEFSVFVNALSKKEPGEAEKLLRWFREWRQRLVDTRVRFILTGSIGIDTVLRRLKLGDTVNDCRPIEMVPPTHEDARAFLNQRASENSILMTDELAAEVISLLGPPWYYPLQIFLTEIQTWTRRNGRPPLVTELQEIYRERLVCSGNENVKHMWDKIDEMFDAPEAKFAHALLKDLSRNKDGFSRLEIENIYTKTFPPGGSEQQRGDFNFVLNVLRHDGYLVQDSQGAQKTKFTSNLLRDYWARQYV